jgi:hypothetical protein
MAGLADREQAHLETRRAWRARLAEHQGTSTGVWLVTYAPSAASRP